MHDGHGIQYFIEPHLSVDEFISVLDRSTLAQRRPVEDRARIAQMLIGATHIVTARTITEDGARLVGVARAVSDGAYCTYLSDLAVDQTYQGQGIGRTLLDRVHRAAGYQSTLILLAAPKAVSYYKHIGMQLHPSCWIAPATSAPAVAAPVAHSEQNTVSGFFDSLTADYEASIARCVPRYAEMLATLLKYIPASQEHPQSILELGAGTGNLSRRLAQQYPDAELHLLDISEASLDCSVQRLSAIGCNMDNVHRCCQDMREYSFPLAQFDVVISTISIHHLNSAEKRELFAACYQTLRPGGVFTFSDQFSAETDEMYQKHMSTWHDYAMASGASNDEWQMWMDHQEKHDYHDPLPQQLEWLQHAGFQHVDCPWRYALWSIVQGIKPDEPPVSKTT